MAQKPTIFKAELEVADLNRNHHETYPLTIARHASETDERMMVRILAFACHAHERLRFSEGLANSDDPALWQKDLTGAIELWIDVGQPDERRLLKACGRAERVVVYSYNGRTEMTDRLRGQKNLAVFQLNPSGLAALADRTMKLHCLIQEGQLWLTAGDETLGLEVSEVR